VLLVDDDQAVREALRNVLQQTGYEVVLAPDGQEGADLLKARCFDLLLLDLELPGLSGWEVLDLSREHYPSMPVVILTGFLGQCVPGSLEGTDARLEKPPDVIPLLETIAELLAESPASRLKRRSRRQTETRGFQPQKPVDHGIP